MAAAIAPGATSMSDIAVLAHLAPVLGDAPSGPTVRRALDLAGMVASLERIARARAKARAHMRQLMEGTAAGFPWLAIAGKTLTCWLVIDMDATLVTASTCGKQLAEPNFKGFGHHPLLGYGDNTGEPLAGVMRRGSAGSNTTADHLQVLGDAIAALPPEFRRRLMVTADGAGASHGLITRLDQLAARRGYELTYSVGWELGARERAAIRLVPQQAWQIAIDQRGEVRERRTGDACADRSCGHPRCWVEEAHVTELTGLLREGPHGDQLDGWPAAMRVFARRERPHPGAQLSLFETQDGWRYSLWVSNVPAQLRGWRAQLGYIDAAHRVHARVEDCIRTGKDCGIGRFPSHDFAMNSA